MPPVSLPQMTVAPGQPLRITPTDVSQFVRLEQCERFLRFRLAERAGQKFMEEYDVIPQRITPLLSLSGQTFEEGIEKLISAGKFRTVHYAEKYNQDHNRPANNTEVIAEARNLEARRGRPPVPATPGGRARRLAAPGRRGPRCGWSGRGRRLHALIADMKSTAEVKVEHRLQVAFYRLMLDRSVQERRHHPRTGPDGHPLPPTRRPDARRRDRDQAAMRDAAKKSSAWTTCLLEVVADQKPTSSRPTTSCWPRIRRPAGWPALRSSTCPTACPSSATAASTTSSA